MPSLFGGVEVDAAKVEEPIKEVVSTPDTVLKESKFGGVQVDAPEQPRPGGGLVEDQTFLEKAEPATLWLKAKNLMRDPDKESAEAVQALVDADSFGIQPHQALRYRDVIDRGVKINPTAASRRSDLTDRINQSWEIGKKQNYVGEIGYKYVTTGDPRFLEQIRDVKFPDETETFISESRLEDATRSAAKLMPMVIETGTESVGKGMKVGMGFGLISALLGPEAVIPATLAGFKIGATSGAFEASLRKEAGLALSEIINFKDEEGNEIDPNIARATAFGIGSINAGLEVAQLRLLVNTIPGMDKLFSEATMEVVASKAVKDKLLALASKFGQTVATETAQEVAQESNNIVFEELAKNINNRLLDTDIPQTDVDTVLDRLGETMKESAQGFAVIGLPGTIAKAGLVRSEKAGEAQAEATQEEVAPGEAVAEDIAEDGRTEEQILKSIEGQETIQDTEIDNLLNIDEAQVDAEIDRIIAAEEAETVADVAQEEIGPKTKVFQESVAQVVGAEEATAVNTLLDARAKAAGMTTDEYIDLHGLELVDGEAAVEAEGDLAQAEEQTKTPEFKEFFGDSKVVDQQGDPLVIFHGTKADVTDDFAFDPSKIGEQGRSEGAGFYFTDSAKIAKGYAGETGTVITGHLSIQKPIEFNQPAFDEDTTGEILKKVAELEAEEEGLSIGDGFLSNFGDVNFEGLDSVINSAVDLMSGEDTALDQLGGIIGSGVEPLILNEAVFEVTGHDGVISEGFFGEGGQEGAKIYVTFFPEQVKSVDNIGTFDPKDPRIFKQAEQTKSTGETKADITFEDTKTIIRAFETADVSSLVHELGHVFRRDLSGDELSTVETWAGVEEGNWDVAAEEKFARGWENYLATGEAPTAELQSVFEKFKQWMSEIYKSIKGSSIDVEITPEIKAVFDSLLTPAEEVAPLAQAAEGGELFQTEQEFNDSLEENFRENYIQGYSQEILDEYNELLNTAVLAAEKNLDEIQKKEDAVTLKEIKEEAEDIVSSSGVFRDWIEAIDEGGLNLETAKELSDNETVNQLMRRRPGLFKKGAALHSDHFANRLGFDTADEMFQQWLDAGTKKEAVAQTASDLMNQYEAETEIGRDLTRREDLFDLELKELDKVLMKKRPVQISEIASRNKLRAAIEKLDKLLAKEPGKRTAKDIRDIKSLQSKKDRIERLIAEGGAFVESLPRAAAGKGIEGPASTKIELKKAITNARKALAKGDKAGVAKERARIKEIMARATARRKKSASVKHIKASIKRELKFSKVKKQSGKPVGKFTAEIQDVLNTLISVSKLKPAEAEARIAKNLEQYQNEPPPQDVVIENHMLEMVARVDTMKDPEQLQGLLDEIKALKDEGRLINELKKFNRESQTIERVAATVEDLGGVPEGARLTGIKDFVPTSTTAKVKRALKTLGKTIVGWDDLMDILSFGTDTAPGESFISKDNDLLGTKNKEKRGTRIAMDTVNTSYMDAFGLKSNRQVIKKVQDDNSTVITLKKVPMTSPVDGSYIEMDLNFTKAEMRKRAMELSDPSLTASFKEMGYNEDTKAFIFQSLTDEDKAFMKSQMEFYGEFYEGTNDVYKAMYGVNLPRNEFYTPLSREGISKPVDDGMGEFMKEMSFRASAASAGALKSRVGSTLTISKQSDIAMLERHITEMEHFKAWGEKIRDLNAVWKNPDVRAAVEINHGADVLGLVDNFISDIAAGSSRMGQKLKGLDLLRVNFTKSVLAVNPDVTIKQLTSFVAYAEKMPVHQFVKYQLKFWANPVKNMRTIYTSELMKARAGNIERDIKDAMGSTEKKAFGNDQSLINMMLLNIKLGDQGAIVIGGWAYYQYLRDAQGMTHDQAINKFEKFTENTQQSADITEQSYWQRGGSLAKLVTMFASSPNQYLRKEIGALRNLAAGRQGAKQTAKALIIYHMLLPMFFQFVSDRFSWDKEEQKRAFIFGALNGWFIVGDGLDYLLRQMLDMKTFNMELPVYSVIHDIIKATDIVDLFDLSADEFFRAIRGVAGVAGAATGIPFKQFADEGKGVIDVLDGQYEQGLTEIMGYSPYLSEKLAND